ncbi:hypothetical protein E2562_005699 [Oryza meyeriana var. granulata]|uniref:Uncharacterized protein n=1 Tax=Oryza meyeriana var. granulata TaxID=110450 RepID=A0A6G1F4A4_9ORYZ|nr:hypothetical protein E2562_005699 [Oryza meyeriana var. granulata]
MGADPVADNEDDYQNYRRAAKQHWDMMKQYYEKVMKYLEKKSIVWTEEEANLGTILIPINQTQDQQAVRSHRLLGT